jgi:hypothetical protein
VLDDVEARYRRMFPPDHVALVASAIVRMGLLEGQGVSIRRPRSATARWPPSNARRGTALPGPGAAQAGVSQRGARPLRRGRADAERAIATALSRLPGDTPTADAGTRIWCSAMHTVARGSGRRAPRSRQRFAISKARSAITGGARGACAARALSGA